MAIRICGIIESYDEGNRNVALVVKDSTDISAVKHNLGVDFKINRVTILKFLADFYGLPPGQIEWPKHISTKPGDIEN